MEKDKYKIMIIEDDVDIAGLLQTQLRKYGFCPYCSQEIEAVDEECRRIEPHLILLDITLPFYDGFYWCHKLRKYTSCPIIFISARNADSDQILAMRNGGDDYVSKPFSMEVLLAKIDAQLRRAYGAYASTNQDQLTYADCQFSMNKLQISRENQIVELSKNEALVIRCLFEKAPDVVTREELLNQIWDEECFVEENTLNVTISRIRKRMEQIESKIDIKAVRGVGYRMGVKE
ncbi:MAG: response regulator transcription factor [Hespellia sp.]|nr:response regulator transcription factor [Hespellia sp.]